MKKVIGLFKDIDTVNSVLMQVEESGLPHSKAYASSLESKERNSGVLVSAGKTVTPLSEKTTGFSMGAVIGALAGMGTIGFVSPIPEAAIGTAAIVFLSATSGALLGGMLQMGIPKKRAQDLTSKVTKGKILVVIEGVPEQWTDKGKDFLYFNGGQDIEII
jgi:outer membrane lipoprotein SlyB